MQDSENHIIHIYGFDEKLSMNENDLTLHLQKALQPLVDNLPEIKIRGRSDRIWAYISVSAQQASKLEKLKKINVGGFEASIGRYYFDHQIFINKLDKSISADQIKEYFSKYGKVVDVVITTPDRKNDDDHNNCYMKVESQDLANKIILQKNHSICKDSKLVRTFMLDEDKGTDKKLFLSIEGDIPLPEVFEEKAISYFAGLGVLRERPRFEPVGQNKSKMIVIYTNEKNAANVLSEFPHSELVKEYSESKVKLTLSNFLTKQNKIFVNKLKQTNQAAVMQAFEVFGPIYELSLTKNKFGPGMTAIIGFKHESGYKKALVNYLDEKKIAHLFMGKPNVNVFLAPDDKRSFYRMKNDAKNNSKPQNPMPPMGMPLLHQPPMGMQYPMNMHQPPMGMQHPPINMNQPMNMNNMPPQGQPRYYPPPPK